jgi:hypothetical protein
MDDTLAVESQKVVAMAGSLEREPVKPSEDEIADRAERRCRIQARFDALLAEACAPGYAGYRITTDPPTFRLVPEGRPGSTTCSRQSLAAIAR